MSDVRLPRVVPLHRAVSRAEGPRQAQPRRRAHPPTGQLILYIFLRNFHLFAVGEEHSEILANGAKEGAGGV